MEITWFGCLGCKENVCCSISLLCLVYMPFDSFFYACHIIQITKCTQLELSPGKSQFGDGALIGEGHIHFSHSFILPIIVFFQSLLSADACLVRTVPTLSLLVERVALAQYPSAGAQRMFVR